MKNSGGKKPSLAKQGNNHNLKPWEKPAKYYEI